MLNTIIMIGNLVRDVEMRYTTTGLAIAKFGLANNRTWNDKTTGEKKEEVCFIDCTVIGKSAEIINQYCKKGSKVRITGRLQLERWTDQTGQNRSKHSIMVEDFEFLNTRENSGEWNSSVEVDPFDTPKQTPKFEPKSTPTAVATNKEYDFDDIPF